MEQDVSSMAEATAQAFLRGEVEYGEAVAQIEQRLDPRCEMHPDDAEREAQDILDEYILDLYDEGLFCDALERTAQEVINGTLEYYYAIKRVQSRLHPLDCEDPYASWGNAQELLDWQIRQLK